MKKACIVVFFLFTCAITVAQVNLVKNPSLEVYSPCPDGPDQIKYASGWMSLDSTWAYDSFYTIPGVPEYCNICAGANVYSGIPINGVFTQFPRTGNGMAQVQMFYDEAFGDSFHRDYLQGHLCEFLSVGQSYCVTFYIASEEGSGYSVNHIGAYLDDGSIDTTHNYGLAQIQYTPQVRENKIIHDTVNWTKVQGSFIANGRERLITIGNFSDKWHTAVMLSGDTTGIYGDTTGIPLAGPGGWSWYLVDDISVIKSDAVADAGLDKVIPLSSSDSVIIGDTLGSYLPCYWYQNGILIDSNTAHLKVHPDTTTKYVMSLDVCGHITYDTVVVWVGNVNIKRVFRLMDNVSLLPNPASGAITVEYAKSCGLLIYDIMGKIVLTHPISSQSEPIDITWLTSGVYVVVIRDSETGEEKRIKLVKE